MSLGVKPPRAAGHFRPEPDRSSFAGGSKDWRSTMSTTVPGFAPPRRLVSVLIAALFGLTLSLNPVSTPNAHAAVSAMVGSRVLHVAAAQVGVPYKNGGTSPRTGFDCSGLTLYSYARVGRHLPRTAQQHGDKAAGQCEARQCR